MSSNFQVAGQGYAIGRRYSVPDDAWYLELAETDPPGRTFLTAIVPDEDPDRTPTVCFDEQTGHRDIPYAVMNRFMEDVAEDVAEEVRSSRGWMEITPELLGMTGQLRLHLPGPTAEDEMRALLVADGWTGGAAR